MFKYKAAIIAGVLGIATGAALAQTYPNLNNEEQLTLDLLIAWDASVAGTSSAHKFDGQVLQNALYDYNGQQISLNEANKRICNLVKKNRLFVWSNGIL